MAFTTAKVAGDELPASHLATRFTEVTPLYSFKTANNTAVNNSTVLVNDSDLFWAVAASTTYEFVLTVIYSSNATANFKWALTFPSATVSFGNVAPAIGGGALITAQSGYTSGTAIGIGGAAFDQSLHIRGTIAVSSTAGTLQFQFAQNTANVSDSFTRLGSFGTLRKVA